MKTSEDQARFLYEVNGDATSSLEILTGEKGHILSETEIVLDDRVIEDVILNSVSENAQEIHNLKMLTYLSSLVNPECATPMEFRKQLEVLFSRNTAIQQQDDNEDSHCKYLSRSVLMHNLALSYLSGDEPEKALELLLPLFEQFFSPNTGSNENSINVVNSSNDDEIEIRDVQCRIAFIVLECMLALGRKVVYGINSKENTGECSETEIRGENILTWIQSYITRAAERNGRHKTTQSSSTVRSQSNVIESTTELKFRLHCYKCRFIFASQNEYGKRMKQQQQQRSSSKRELKNAMEIYQHKLIGKKQNTNAMSSTTASNSRSESIDGGASVQGSVYSLSNDVNAHNDYVQGLSGELNNTGGTTMSSISNEVSPSLSSRIIQKQSKRLEMQSQFVLCLKAYSEYLKDNSKKSLKLCAEAKNSGERRRDKIFNDVYNQNSEIAEKVESLTVVDLSSNDIMRGDLKHKLEIQRALDIDSALHYNNLAIVHQTMGKVNIAMHYYARSLSHVENISRSKHVTQAEKDGIINQIPICQILHNAAICSQQLQHFLAAYECMAICLKASPVYFAKKPRCWLRMAESCIGIHFKLKSKGSSQDSMINFIWKRKTKTASIEFDFQNDTCTIASAMTTNLPTDLGNKEDLEYTSSNPLSRALYSLNRCISLINESFEHNTFEGSSNSDVEETAKVALAYVWLELNEPLSVVQIANTVLQTQSFSNFEDQDDDKKFPESLRRRLTLRLYACEAMHILGNPEKARIFLMDGDSPQEREEFITHLSNNLTVPSEGRSKSSSETTNKSELVEIETLIQISLTGALDSMVRAKACKGSLNYQSQNKPGAVYMDGSTRKALIHCLLLDGNNEKALLILKNHTNN